MKASLIYRNRVVYGLVMRALYGRHYGDRYRAIDALIPHSASVLDVCCGPAVLFTEHLRSRGIDYTGLDLNQGFVARVAAAGGRGVVWDVHGDDPFPAADIVVMQASLYHFLPDPAPVVDRMLASARTRVIITEPVRNLASSDNRVISALAKRLTNPGDGDPTNRFTEPSLDAFMARYEGRVEQRRLIAGGREKVYVLTA